MCTRSRPSFSPGRHCWVSCLGLAGHLRRRVTFLLLVLLVPQWRVTIRVPEMLLVLLELQRCLLLQGVPFRRTPHLRSLNNPHARRHLRQEKGAPSNNLEALQLLLLLLQGTNHRCRHPLRRPERQMPPGGGDPRPLQSECWTL